MCEIIQPFFIDEPTVILKRRYMADTSSQPNEVEKLATMRHSLAHVLAAAIQEIWPRARFGVGPAVEDGFYYDIDIPGVRLSETDLPKIEEQMQTIISRNDNFERIEMPIDEAIIWAQQNDQPYKEELLNDLKRAGTTEVSKLNPQEQGMVAKDNTQVSQVSFYKSGKFLDLCRGPHLASTGKVGFFRLVRISGAYWRGNEKNPQLQRIYGVAFLEENSLKEYLSRMEEALKRDHRRLGQELDLFVFSDMVGAGLPLFTPRGTVMREELINFANSLRTRYGYEKVHIPHLTKKELYEKSGHWEKFGDELFLVTSQETSDELILKPMNCPHHTRIYAAQQRSYKDLPVRYLETTTVYRDEKTGELAGLSRVRSITQDDSHVFCSQDQIEAEIANLLEAARELYTTAGMSLKVRLSYRDEGDGYLGDPELWRSSQEQLKKATVANGLEYFEVGGEAAFYGPKIDFIATDALRREHQVATVQLDFVQPERFHLTYIAEDGITKQPVMIHCALLGSVERFMALYIEHTAGKFPVWLAPEQVRLISVNQTEPIVAFAKKMISAAKESGVRIGFDNSNESVSKKIRSAEIAKIPYTVVIGEKEVAANEVVPRIRKDMAVMDVPIKVGAEQFLKTVANEAKSRVFKTSL